MFVKENREVLLRLWVIMVVIPDQSLQRTIDHPPVTIQLYRWKTNVISCHLLNLSDNAPISWDVCVFTDFDFYSNPTTDPIHKTLFDRCAPTCRRASLRVNRNWSCLMLHIVYSFSLPWIGWLAFF